MIQTRRVVLLLAALLAMHAPLLANITVYPMQVFIEHPARSVPINLTNRSDVATEVWISFRFGYPVAFDTGQVQFNWNDSTASPEFNAVSWMRAVPQRIVLQAGESQTVRLLVSPPGVVVDGEYWSRCVISFKRSNASQSATQEQKRGIVTSLISEVVIPVHYRKGQLSSGVSMSNLSAAVEGKRILVAFNLDRRGNAAFWGTAQFNLVNSTGRVVDNRRSPLVIYNRLSYRNLIDIEGLPAGQYTLGVTLDNKHPAINKELRSQSAPVSQSVPVIIP